MSNNPFEDILAELREIKQTLGALNTAPAPKIEIIDRKELLVRLDITEPTAIRWEKRGAIPAIRIGSNVRYNWGSVIDALETSADKDSNIKRSINRLAEKRKMASKTKT